MTPPRPALTIETKALQTDSRLSIATVEIDLELPLLCQSPEIDWDSFDSFIDSAYSSPTDKRRDHRLPSMAAMSIRDTINSLEEIVCKYEPQHIQQSSCSSTSSLPSEVHELVYQVEHFYIHESDNEEEEEEEYVHESDDEAEELFVPRMNMSLFSNWKGWNAEAPKKDQNSDFWHTPCSPLSSPTQSTFRGRSLRSQTARSYREVSHQRQRHTNAVLVDDKTASYGLWQPYPNYTRTANPHATNFGAS